MFNKTKPRTTPAPQPQPVVPPPLNEAPQVNMARTKPTAPVSSGNKPFSSVGSGLLIEGNITGTGDLHLDGTVRGDVKVNHLTVGESGNIEGKVEAETIEVRGRVVGSIQGRQIKLQATAYVEGDITHDQLAIDVGAFFQGRCLQNRRSEQAVSPVHVATPMTDTAPAQPVPVAPPNLTPPSLNTYDMSALSDLT